MAESYVNKWDFSNKHVESTITKDNFLSAARSIIYAAPYQSAQQGTASFNRIGVIQSYGWQEGRNVDIIFEIGSEVPYLVPGRTIGSIQISRMLIFGKDLVNVMYYGGTVPNNADYIRSLKDVTKPLDLMFAAYDNSSAQKVYSRVYTGCHIENRSESIIAGQILIAENISIRYEDIVGISIPSN